MECKTIVGGAEVKTIGNFLLFLVWTLLVIGITANWCGTPDVFRACGTASVFLCIFALIFKIVAEER